MYVAPWILHNGTAQGTAVPSDNFAHVEFSVILRRDLILLLFLNENKTKTNYMFLCNGEEDFKNAPPSQIITRDFV